MSAELWRRRASAHHKTAVEQATLVPDSRYGNPSSTWPIASTTLSTSTGAAESLVRRSLQPAASSCRASWRSARASWASCWRGSSGARRSPERSSRAEHQQISAARQGRCLDAGDLAVRLPSWAIGGLGFPGKSALTGAPMKKADRLHDRPWSPECRTRPEGRFRRAGVLTERSQPHRR